MSPNVRVAVIGVGAWGERQLRACERVPELEVVALCDLRTDRLRALRPRLPAFARIDDLFSSDLAEAVIIATPNASHAALAGQALQAGLHVLVEKPLALTRAEAERVARLADRHARVAMVGHLLEHHPRILALEAMVTAGQLGALEQLESRRLATRVTRDDPWWTLAPHDLSLALRFAGALRAVQFVGEHAGAECFLLEHASGITSRIEVGFGCARKVRELRLVGSAAAAVFDDTVAPARPSPLERQAAAFATAVRAGRAGRGAVAHGVRIVHWLEMGARARARARRGAA
jgi:predicted dehydrogenase